MPNQGTSTGEDWLAHVDREEARYRDGESRLPEAADADARQRQLTRLGNASAGAGLALLMAGRRDEAAASLTRAAERYRESFAGAPPGSWGRPIGAIKARVLAGDWDGAAADARWALEAGAAEADSPIGRYAAALALLVLGDDAHARIHANAVRTRDDFPAEVGDALAFQPTTWTATPWPSRQCSSRSSSGTSTSKTFPLRTPRLSCRRWPPDEGSPPSSPRRCCLPETRP